MPRAQERRWLGTGTTDKTKAREGHSTCFSLRLLSPSPGWPTARVPWKEAENPHGRRWLGAVRTLEENKNHIGCGESNFEFLSFHYVGSKAQTQTLRLGSKCLYLLSRWPFLFLVSGASASRVLRLKADATTPGKRH